MRRQHPALRRLAAAQAMLETELTPDGRRRVEIRPPRYETVSAGTQGDRVLIELCRR